MTRADRLGSDPHAAGTPAEGAQGGGPLRDTQAVSDFVLASSRDSILVLDLDGRTMFVSAGGIEAMEVDDVDALIGHSWLRVWKGADHDAACAAVAAARSGQVGRFQGYCATRTGIPKWWDAIVSPLPAPDGAPGRLVAVCRDVTERHEADEALRASEAQFRTLAQAMPNQVWAAPAGRPARLVQRQGLRLQRRGATARSTAHGWAQHRPPRRPAGGGAALGRRRSRPAQTYETEFRLRRADGAYRWHLARACRSAATTARVVRWIGTNTDIEEQKTQRAQALAHLNADAGAAGRPSAPPIATACGGCRPT